MEEEWQGRPSIVPLLARLERLDSLIKSVEKRQNVTAACAPSGDGRRPVTLDSAVEEAREKGSVLDRLSSIERRLTQLSLQIEASNASNTSTLGSPSTKQGSSNNNYSLSFPASLDERLPTQQKDHKQHGNNRSTINKQVSTEHAMDLPTTGRDQDVDKKDLSNKIKMRSNKSKARSSSWCKRLLGC